MVGGLGGDERGGMSTGEAVARYFWMQRFVVSFILPSVRFLIHLTFVRSISMTSIELVRPRGVGRGAGSAATTSDVELLLPSAQALGAGVCFKSRQRSGAPVSVAAITDDVDFLTRLGDVVNRFPSPPRPGDPNDRRRVWVMAFWSFVLMVVMFCLVDAGSGSSGSNQTNERALENMPSVNLKRNVGPSSYKEPPLEKVAASSDENTVGRNPPAATHNSSVDEQSEEKSETYTKHSPEDARKGQEAAMRMADATKALGGSFGAVVNHVSKATENHVSYATEKLNLDFTSSISADTKIQIPRTANTCVTEEHVVPLYAPDAFDDPVDPEEGFPTNWVGFADVLATDAKNAKDVKMVLLGDSITEAWRGTSLGVRVTKYADAPKVLQANLGHLNPLALAISGDTTGNLLWRLRNRGFPRSEGAVAGDEKTTLKTQDLSSKTTLKYVALLIGTNDLSRSIRNVNGGLYETGCSNNADVETLLRVGVPQVVRGIVTVIDELVDELIGAGLSHSPRSASLIAHTIHCTDISFLQSQDPSTKVIVLGLTPRGEKSSFAQPSIWTGALDLINSSVKHRIEQNTDSKYANVVFQPCTEPFLRVSDARGTEIRETAMPDGLHPQGPDGFEAMGKCLVDGVAKAERVLP